MRAVDILYEASCLLNNDETSSFLKDYIEALDAETELPVATSSVEAFVNKLLVCLNMTVERIASEHIFLKKEEPLTSDENGKIGYSSFSSRVFEVVKVFDSITGEELVPYFAFDGLVMPLKYRPYKVLYKFVPSVVTDLDDEIVVPTLVSSRLLCFGIVADFLLTRNVFDEAREWNNKFLDGIRLVSRLSRERVFR